MSKAEDRQWAQESLIFDVTEDVLIAMEDAGISQQELARKMGKSRSHISQLLSGERNMTLRTLASLCYELGAEIKAKITHPNAPQAWVDSTPISSTAPWKTSKMTKVIQLTVVGNQTQYNEDKAA